MDRNGTISHFLITFAFMLISFAAAVFARDESIAPVLASWALGVGLAIAVFWVLMFRTRISLSYKDRRPWRIPPEDRKPDNNLAVRVEVVAARPVSDAIGELQSIRSLQQGRWSPPINQSPVRMGWPAKNLESSFDPKQLVRKNYLILLHSDLGSETNIQLYTDGHLGAFEGFRTNVPDGTYLLEVTVSNSTTQARIFIRLKWNGNIKNLQIRKASLMDRLFPNAR